MKKSLPLFALLLFFSPLFAQPINDDCSGLIDLGIGPICPVTGTFTNVDATLSNVFTNPTDNIPQCFTGGVIDRDVWFSFTVPPDGSVVDFTITVTGVNGPNGSIVQPQIAIYRGDCLLDELQELDCATSAPTETTVEIDLLGLTPGLPYFLRISDWTASASPNWGDFELCIKEYEPVFNMGGETFTEACAGTLYDSGGPTGDYSNSQNLSFTVCPQDFHQCIFVDIQSFATEFNFDYLNIFMGDDTNDPMLTSVNGFGGNVQLQLFSQCVTFQFTSDGSVVDAGFELTWFCSPDTCTVPPPSTCDNPTPIPSLPYTANGMTTCNAANTVTTSPCNDDDWLGTDDVIFTYTSPGEECIAVSITGSNSATGVGIFNACPNLATDCIAQSGGGFGQNNPSISAAYLETPGTYYIVVDNATACTPFNIEVMQVTCPIVFPSAADCEDALTLNGCGELPAIISVAPGQGNANFIQDGVNDGCWGGFPPNFTWFYFQAQQDGDFGFVMDATNPAEASDIDFQVWGPIENFEDICDFAMLNQPIRSSYAAGADPTGLADIHPVTGAVVTDTCETAAGDDFVSTIPVQTGEFYVVLVNDWGGQITSGAVSIDFGNTTMGVLDAAGTNFMVSQDTAVCPGETAQLFASGGEVYQWFPADGLSCIYCPNPVATVTTSTVYNVAINNICVADTLEVEVGFLQVDAGPDLTVCLNEEIQIVAGASFANVSYLWGDPNGFLSCTDCPDPIVTAAAAGTFTFNVTVTGPTCSFSDSMTLTVLPGEAPAYQISPDQGICVGETVNLGGSATPGVTYTWTSDPPGFLSSQANPSVTPSITTVYYLQLTNSTCPFPSFDSVLVTVANLPVVDVANDTLICLGESVVLGTTQPEPGVSYVWTNPGTLNNPNIANPLATPTQTTSYTVTATRLGCSVQAVVNVQVTQIGVEILADDVIPICKGTSVPLAATAFPAGTAITWSPGDGSLNTTTGPNVVATPQTATFYVASVTVPGCVEMDTVYVGVDSLPWAMEILPTDTVICQGEQVLLTSPVYEPGDFSQIKFLWTPTDGQLTPDSFYNMVVQPLQTTVYQRIATNGFCSDTLTATVTVFMGNAMLAISNDTTICGNQTVTLFADAGVPGSYTWSNGGAGQAVTPDLQTGINTFTVTFLDECGNSLTDMVEVELLPGIGVTIATNSPDSVYLGAEITLNSQTTQPAITYQWSNGSTADTANVTAFNPPSETFAVTVTDDLGCTGMDTITFTVLEPQFDIPNAFSPNGDDLNQHFKVVILGENIEVLSSKIWNRWGQMVFEESNGNTGWDGTQGGDPAASDVYVYRIVIQLPDGTRFTESGDVTLLR
ncbi:MAG: gliding motility-associated C-terminal domain-containing protein [Bacteroidetes bacterium]|nr:gliding motility-associated C-terminal domain-containing protein [Bacteroidota bacterium]